MFDLELFDEELEMHNAKMRLLSWLFDEIEIQKDIPASELQEIGMRLPLNV